MTDRRTNRPTNAPTNRLTEGVQRDVTLPIRKSDYKGNFGDYLIRLSNRRPILLLILTIELLRWMRVRKKSQWRLKRQGSCQAWRRCSSYTSRQTGSPYTHFLSNWFISNSHFQSNWFISNTHFSSNLFTPDTHFFLSNWFTLHTSRQTGLYLTHFLSN